MSKAWRLQFIAVGLVLASSLAARATDIYVDNLIGDDRSSGHSPKIGTSASGPVPIGEHIGLQLDAHGVVVFASTCPQESP